MGGRERERDRERDRERECVCVSRVYTNWSAFENNSLTSLPHSLPSKHYFIVIPEWWSAKGEKTSFGNWIPDKKILLRPRV